MREALLRIPTLGAGGMDQEPSSSLEGRPLVDYVGGAARRAEAGLAALSKLVALSRRQRRPRPETWCIPPPRRIAATGRTSAGRLPRPRWSR